MLHIFTELSKYILIIMIAIYTFQCFSVFGKKKDEEKVAKIYKRQMIVVFMIHLICNILIIMNEKKMVYFFFYLGQFILLVVIFTTYRKIYETASNLIVNNMCMLLSIGFVMLTRLDFNSAFKQFAIAVVGVMITLLIPLIVHKIHIFKRLSWVYAAIGIALLGVVAIAGDVSYGAKLSISFGGISLQPSEFIKILFVIFVASMLYKSTEKQQIIKTVVVALLHIGMLVMSKDLGAALIYFVAYVVMVYAATREPKYILAGAGLGAVASVFGYFAFSHVKVRVMAWKDPLSVYSSSGYQVSNSLFAIGSGGWIGLGLYCGMPDSIPVVKQDFIFAAISEELGGIFALCVILICASCFLMFMNISMQIRDPFYKLIALGLGTIYATQVILTIGGVTKFIPSTGVTLPLVSYGGSSLLSTLIIFAIIQGLYILRRDEGANNEKKAIRRRNDVEESRKRRKINKRRRDGEFDTEETFEDLD